jgi:hypothetical protein
MIRHQKQALTFMLHREHGWSMDERNHDIWTKEKDSMGRVGSVPNVMPSKALTDVFSDIGIMSAEITKMNHL